MEKIEKKTMDLNRETAMRLWNKSFGKESKVKDYAGRVIAKGAYDDRNSEYGWNVDHILPQSKGGVTAEHNLICCHIATNDEKADRFPCFNANGISFEIIKVQNHYEIREKSKKENQDSQEFNQPDLFDSAAGIRLFKSLKGIQNKKRFVGTIFIYLKAVTNGALIDFIQEIFCEENISFRPIGAFDVLGFHYRDEISITVSDYDMPLRDDSEELLDKCILLNTYLSAYFLKSGYISGYDIYYREDYFETKGGLFTSGIKEPRESDLGGHNTLHLNELALTNTDAGKKVQKVFQTEYYEYDQVFKGLENNLIKEAKG